jgi:hypothetical protein
MLSGLCIAWYYVASPEKASLSLNFLKDTVFAGTLVISLHAVNAILLVFLIVAFIFVTLVVHTKPGGKFRLIAFSMCLLLLVCCGIATGAVIAEKPWAVSFMRHLFAAKSVSESSPLPPLFDPFSLVFSRAFLFHALILPAAVLYTAYLVAKHSSTIGPEPLNPVVKHSARFAMYLTFTLVIAWFFMGPLTHR